MHDRVRSLPHKASGGGIKWNEPHVLLTVTHRRVRDMFDALTVSISAATV